MGLDAGVGQRRVLVAAEGEDSLVHVLGIEDIERDEQVEVLASLMLAQGTDLYVVSEVLGHASIAITKDVYGHLVEGHKRTASESMADSLLGPHGSQFGSHGVSGAS